MYIVVKHEINDPARFGQTVEGLAPKIPDGITHHSAYPSTDWSEAMCLWEAPSVDALQKFLDKETGKASRNDYFPVAAEQAVGLPN